MINAHRTNELLVHIAELLHELIYLKEQDFDDYAKRVLDCKECNGEGEATCRQLLIPEVAGESEAS